MGTHWILCKTAGGFHLGLVSLYGVLTPEGYIGTCRVCLESHGPPQQHTTLHGSPQPFRDWSWFTYWTRKMHLIQNAQLTPELHHTLGRWSRDCTMMWNHLHHHPSPCRQSTGVFNLFGDQWEHLCAPICHLEHHKLLQGANPLSTAFGSSTTYYGTYGLH